MTIWKYDNRIEIITIQSVDLSDFTKDHLQFLLYCYFGIYTKYLSLVVYNVKSYINDTKSNRI